MPRWGRLHCLGGAWRDRIESLENPAACRSGVQYAAGVALTIDARNRIVTWPAEEILRPVERTHDDGRMTDGIPYARRHRDGGVNALPGHDDLWQRER